MPRNKMEINDFNELFKEFASDFIARECKNMDDLYRNVDFMTRAIKWQTQKCQLAVKLERVCREIVEMSCQNCNGALWKNEYTDGYNDGKTQTEAYIIQKLKAVLEEREDAEKDTY